MNALQTLQIKTNKKEIITRDLKGKKRSFKELFFQFLKKSYPQSDNKKKQKTKIKMIRRGCELFF
jgi:hypothetical protein